MASKSSKKPSGKPVKKAVKALSKVVAKKPVAKKPAPKVAPKAVKPVKKAPVKASKAPAKVAAKKPTPKMPVKMAVKVEAPKAAAKTPAKAAPAKKTAPVSAQSATRQQFVKAPPKKNLKLTPFLQKQRQRLLELKDSLLDSMRGVARDNLHSGTDTSAFGMHQADAGSDAYDRDFALSMLSKEQSSLYEIDEALKRIEDGSYGICDLCQKPIKHERLEALPFTRYTVDCQSELEKRQHHTAARPQITSLFGLTEEEEESEEEENAENA